MCSSGKCGGSEAAVLAIIRERDKLKQELATVTEERDEYWNALMPFAKVWAERKIYFEHQGGKRTDGMEVEAGDLEKAAEVLRYP